MQGLDGYVQLVHLVGSCRVSSGMVQLLAIGRAMGGFHDTAMHPNG